MSSSDFSPEGWLYVKTGVVSAYTSLINPMSLLQSCVPEPDPMPIPPIVFFVVHLNDPVDIFPAVFTCRSIPCSTLILHALIPRGIPLDSRIGCICSV